MILSKHYSGIVLALLLSSFNTLALASTAPECVILLHGMGRSAHSMNAMKNYLKAHDYIVINKSYPSTEKSIAAIANNDIPKMISACDHYNVKKIHFVTHSLGGIVLRKHLTSHHIKNLGRIVMLSPPNHGSPFADWLRSNALYQQITGQAGQALTTSKQSLVNQLPNMKSYEVGIIAGNASLTGDLFIDEESDGIVPVKSTHVVGMKDFIVLPVTHSFMMWNKQVMREALAFIRTGRFQH